MPWRPAHVDFRPAPRTPSHPANQSTSGRSSFNTASVESPWLERHGQRSRKNSSEVAQTRVGLYSGVLYPLGIGFSKFRMELSQWRAASVPTSNLASNNSRRSICWALSLEMSTD